MPPNKKQKSLIPAQTVTFDYIKSNSFHSILADGVIGGVTPHKHIHMAFFNERTAIPRRILHELKKDGSLGDISGMETRNSIIREMNVDVFMTLAVAKSIHEWLGKKIKETETISKAKAKKK